MKKKNDALNNIFRCLSLSDINDLDMTCRDFVNALKMLTCSEKTPCF